MINREMLLTINEVPGKKIKEVVGYVKGSTVQTRHVGKDIMASFRSLVGGEVVSYAEMMNDARQIATERLLRDAEALGANAVVGFRLQSSTIMGGAAEIIAYGTAVIVE